MLENFLNKAVRASAELTNSYVAGTVLDNCQEFNQLNLWVNYTKASSDSLQVKVEFSVDGTNYFQETNASVSSGTTTIYMNEYSTASTGAYEISIPISCRYVKVSAKCTGTVTSTACAINAILHRT